MRHFSWWYVLAAGTLSMVTACEADDSTLYPPAGIYSFYDPNGSGSDGMPEGVFNQINEVIKAEGGEQLVPQPDDMCYGGFTVVNADGTFQSYFPDQQLMRQEKRVVFRKSSSNGRCTYDASKRIETCDGSDGAAFIVYPGQDFTRFGTTPDAATAERWANETIPAADLRGQADCKAQKQRLLEAIAADGPKVEATSNPGVFGGTFFRGLMTNPHVAEAARQLGG